MSSHFFRNRYDDDLMFDDMDDDMTDPMQEPKVIVHQDFFNNFEDDIDEDELIDNTNK
ncbi:hypothetical protein DFA_09839 [Cavenderia fasciculata]|uniref:Uncharacterized protein n=1 Tax=Cavenderia fasciculata TaxID=261658 RepID=F4QAV8_CACFS|nr:uncharacterized protein DFA_09839 [Cavenderia fasciculata]EGG15017.1 hypothetical protein DFA_09839 [Cavenderia fasciculata]|eukprot:XP_004351737.1 hypothetical protein DFA_09839 [Cavenderia fasciculata]